jgi:UDP-N-acetylmuramyl pentapeptide phosphotransferase/UDP-N-acetylglucosamine-1-phosphate transferase
MASVVLLGVLVAVSWLLVGGLERWAQRRNLLDVPNARSSHTRATPRGGGLAIVVVTLVTATVVLVARGLDAGLLRYVLGAALIAGVSWLDDVRSLPWSLRITCHLVAAVIFVAGVPLNVNVLGLDLPPWLVAPALVIWVVGLTNVYNFMDGIDGLAAGQAVVAASWWAVVGTLADVPPLTTIAGAVAASSFGFLLHNWAPARIFMGDVGSAFLGYTFAVLPLLAIGSLGQWGLLVGGVLAVWPFVFDGGLTIVRRALNGENVFQAHRSHLYQRLAIRWGSHATVSALYIAYAVISVACAQALVVGGQHWAILLVPLALAVLLFVGVEIVSRQER